MSTVCVTGISGYIGGQVALRLKDQGYAVVGVDREPLPDHLVNRFDHFLQADFDSDAFDHLVRNGDVTTIVHCAGTSLVGPSISKPSDYYYNNTVKTINLLNKIVNGYPARPKIIFSSSAAVYGNPVITPCHEHDPTEPISPYGQSKLAIDWALESYRQAYGLKYVSFRYFNACGADPEARHGQAKGATHIIARVLESIVDHTDFVCFGNDYTTRDGTCVRDYIHVDDIALAHVRAIEVDAPSGVYNLSNNAGYTNLEIVKTAEKVTGEPVVLCFGGRRAGDPDELTADPGEFKRVTGWGPKYNLKDMIQHAWSWYKR